MDRTEPAWVEIRDGEGRPIDREQLPHDLAREVAEEFDRRMKELDSECRAVVIAWP